MRSSKSRSRNKSRNRPQGGGNIVNRVFDSSGPEGKVRGTPAQIIEKYNQLARDAQLSGDRVALENFQQHSEHYTRMLAAAQKELDARQQGGGQQHQPSGGQQHDDRQGGQQGHQGGQAYQERRGEVADQQPARDGGQGGGGAPSGDQPQRDAQQRDGQQGGRRNNRRRERDEDRGHAERGEDRGRAERGEQGGAIDVIEPAPAEAGPVPTPEGGDDGAAPERPRRARTRRKAPGAGEREPQHAADDPAA